MNVSAEPHNESQGDPTMAELNDDGGPAFPTNGPAWSDCPRCGIRFQTCGMTLREYACIQLRVPETGKPWLDAIINKSRADQFAGMALEGLLSTDDDTPCQSLTEPDIELERQKFAMSFAQAAVRYAAAMLAVESKQEETP